MIEIVGQKTVWQKCTKNDCKSALKILQNRAKNVCKSLQKMLRKSAPKMFEKVRQKNCFAKVHQKCLQKCAKKYKYEIRMKTI